MVLICEDARKDADPPGWLNVPQLLPTPLPFVTSAVPTLMTWAQSKERFDPYFCFKDPLDSVIENASPVSCGLIATVRFVTV